METHKKILLTFCIVFSLLLLMISQTQLGFQLRSTLENITAFIFQPVTHSSKNAEIEKLQKENAKLLSQLAQLEKLKRENNALSDQFAIQNPKSELLIPATIIGRFGDIAQDKTPYTIILNKGSDDGVAVGQGVVVDNVVVGKIKQVSINRSYLMPLFDEDIRISGKTASSSGIVRGDGSGSIIFGNVTLKDTLKVGDLVVTSEDVVGEKGFLPDLAIGTIQSIEKKSSDLFQSAKLKSPIDIAKVETVFIIQ